MKTRHTGLIMTLLSGMVLLAACGGSNSKDMELGGINTGDFLDGLMSRTQKTLASVNSIATAQAAVPQLKAINDDFDDLIYHLPNLSEKGRADIAKKAKRDLPQIQDMAGRINDNSSLRSILGPEMNLMVEKIGMLL